MRSSTRRCLHRRCRRAAQDDAEGKITGCVVDGPLSMDIAIDPEAAHHKVPRTARLQAMRTSCCSPTFRPQPRLQDAGPHCRLQERLYPDRYQGPRYPDEPLRFLPDEGQLHRTGCCGRSGAGSVIVKSLPHRGKVAELSEADEAVPAVAARLRAITERPPLISRLRAAASPQGGSQRILKETLPMSSNPGHQPRLHLYQGRRVRGRDPAV